MVLLLLLALLIVLIAGMLLARLELYIDTYRHLYRLRWGIALSARVETQGEEPALSAQFGPFHKRWTLGQLLFGKKEQKKEKEKPKPKKQEKAAPSKPFPFRLIFAVMKTFRVRQFRMELDTNDYVWNAWLFTPVFLMPALRQRVHVNFLGHNGLVLQVDNRLWNMGVAALKTLIY